MAVHADLWHARVGTTYPSLATFFPSSVSFRTMGTAGSLASSSSDTCTPRHDRCDGNTTQANIVENPVKSVPANLLKQEMCRAVLVVPSGQVLYIRDRVKQSSWLEKKGVLIEECRRNNASAVVLRLTKRNKKKKEEEKKRRSTHNQKSIQVS